jgi:hypothetical protein
MAEQSHEYRFAAIDLTPQFCEGGHHPVEGLICPFGIRTLEKAPLLGGCGDVAPFLFHQNPPRLALLDKC